MLELDNMGVEPDDDYYDDDPNCSICGGEGWDDCPCAACGGSGLAKDQTIW